jgi:CHASE3 domain sensor protein
MFYEAAATQLRALLAAARDLAEHTEPSIRNIISDLERTAGAALELIRPLVDEDLANAVALCGKIAGILKSFSDAVNLPSPDVVNQARVDMEKKFEEAAKAVKKVGLDEKEVQAIAAALNTDAGVLINVRDALRSALNQLLQIKDNVCSAAPDRLPLDAFAALWRMRSTILDAVHSFTAGLSSPHFRATDLKSILAKITGSGTDPDAARKAVIDAAKAGAQVVVAFCQLVRDATALRDTGANGPLKTVRDDLAALGNAKLDAIVAIIDDAKPVANKLRSDLDKIITDLNKKITDPVPAGGEQTYLKELLDLVDKVPPLFEQIQSRIVQGLEQAVLRGLAAFLVGGEPYLKQMVLIAFQGIAPVFKFLSRAQAALVDARNAVWLALGGTSSDPSGGEPVGNELSNLTVEKVRGLLLVKCSARAGLTCPAGQPHVPDDDYLTAEKTELARLDAAFASNDPKNFDSATLNAVLELFRTPGASIKVRYKYWPTSLPMRRLPCSAATSSASSISKVQGGASKRSSRNWCRRKFCSITI